MRIAVTKLPAGATATGSAAFTSAPALRLGKTIL
jgi:hypothetical protein